MHLDKYITEQLSVYFISLPFSINRPLKNYELKTTQLQRQTRVGDVMMARPKRIYVLILKMTKQS